MLHSQRMYQPRSISTAILKAQKAYPVLVLTGPRQSGKTTLCRHLFPDFLYQNLESPDTRRFALDDPRAFLAQSNTMVIDEVQHTPELFSYIQALVDEQPQRSFVLTGSQNFQLMESISQSLAGRGALFTLLPLDSQEQDTPSSPYDSILTGSYPRVLYTGATAADWYPNYIQTYLEKDVRALSAINDLERFRTFLHLLAGRTATTLNLTQIANDADISVNTVKNWLSLLQASYIVFLLPSWHQHPRKQLIKSPRVFFYDTGVVCSLLGIKRVEDIVHYPLYGQLFETLVVSDIYRQHVHQQLPGKLFYWRDNTGKELDLVYQLGTQHFAVCEIKGSQTFVHNAARHLKQSDAWWPDGTILDKYVIYAGSNLEKRTDFYPASLGPA